MTITREVFEIHCILKLSDFGCSKVLSSTIGFTGSFVRTDTWVAPEIQRGQFHTTHTDIYSLGLVLFGIFKKSNLKNELRTLGLVSGLVNHWKLLENFEDSLFIGFKYLISGCLEKESSNRFSSREIVLRLDNQIIIYNLQDTVPTRLENRARAPRGYTRDDPPGGSFLVENDVSEIIKPDYSHLTPDYEFQKYVNKIVMISAMRDGPEGLTCKYVDAQDGSTGAIVKFHPKNQPISDSQQWIFEKLGDNCYCIKVRSWISFTLV